VLLIAPSIQEHSRLDNRKVIFFATLLVFHGRYKHLTLLSTALREHKPKRIDVYRKFANHFRDALKHFAQREAFEFSGQRLRRQKTRRRAPTSQQQFDEDTQALSNS
jgi:hypothetical protein